MTGFEIETVPLSGHPVAAWGQLDARFRNWPVVYILDDGRAVYVGESLNAAARLRQHMDSPRRQHLQSARVIIDETFNKSVCLDLESFLIRLFAGDGRYEVLNRNVGITDAAYYQRQEYRRSFNRIFEELRRSGAFTQSVRDIENSDLFKLSPFKALTADQTSAVVDILTGLFADIEEEAPSRVAIQGDPGTGKTIVAIYLVKLLVDIQQTDPREPVEDDSILSEFFVEGYPEMLTDWRMGLVVPQQSLRTSIKNVFHRTPGLSESMVMTPFDVGTANERFDLLIVDEAHRLNQRANQPSGVLNAKFRSINEKLFGRDDTRYTQLDWITHMSDHQVFLLDRAQSVRPHDVDAQHLDSLLEHVDLHSRRYRLTSQMRVQAGDDYAAYVRRVLSADPPSPRAFPGYDLRMFDSLAEMRDAVLAQDAKHGLARLVAGYAWPWRSKNDARAYDIEMDGVGLRWNTTAVDWINAPGSVHEVGSIHTVQGYDLNVAGVVIGNDLRFDQAARRLVFDRASYHDKKGMEGNRARGITYSDADILRLVLNIYAVLLTRGMRGTYVYVCDPALRDYLRRYFAHDTCDGRPSPEETRP